MKQFILGFLAASVLGAGLVWAQSGYTTDQYGNRTGTIYQQPAMPATGLYGASTDHAATARQHSAAEPVLRFGLLLLALLLGGCGGSPEEQAAVTQAVQPIPAPPDDLNLRRPQHGRGA